VQRGLRAVNAIGYGGMSLVFATGAVAPFAPGEPHLAGTAARLVAGTFATLFATTSITMAAPKTMDRHLWQPLRRLIGTERAAK